MIGRSKPATGIAPALAAMTASTPAVTPAAPLTAARRSRRYCRRRGKLHRNMIRSLHWLRTNDPEERASKTREEPTNFRLSPPIGRRREGGSARSDVISVRSGTQHPMSRSLTRVIAVPLLCGRPARRLLFALLFTPGRPGVPEGPPTHEETSCFAASFSARPERFELPTFGSVDRRSIQLSYGRLCDFWLQNPHSCLSRGLMRVPAPGPDARKVRGMCVVGSPDRTASLRPARSKDNAGTLTLRI
jgi:hypothetical protein